MNCKCVNFMYPLPEGGYSYHQIIPEKLVFEYNTPLWGDAFMIKAFDFTGGDFSEFSLEGIIRGTIRHTLDHMSIECDENQVEEIFKSLNGVE